MKKLFLYCLLVLFISFSCSKNIEKKEITLFPKDYYPLKIGNSYIYEVDSIHFDDFTGDIDTLNFEIKEVITDTFRDLNGTLAYRLERSRKFENKNDWEQIHIWWVNLADNKSVQRTENNIRIVNLTLPIKDNITWKGNVFNALPEWDFRYTNINLPYNQFDSTVTVIQREIPENLIEKEYYEQKFAKNIGLIYYHYIDVSSENNLSIPLMSRIESGVIYTQKLKSFDLK